MKNKSIYFLSLFVLQALTALPQNFSWEKGEQTGNTNGSYGTLNVASASNNPSGRSKAAQWKDKDGNFWIFGGDKTLYTSSPTYRNDLLKYDLATGMWTWKKGPAYTSNSFGVYGQKGTAGAQNNPGARKNAATWTDTAGNLWLFGGFGFAASGFDNFLNDLWKYDPGTGMWTWVKGTNQTFQLGTYGTKGVPDAANTPGCREGSVTWVDDNGHLWLYGGKGRNANGDIRDMSDLWRYNIADNTWTWMSGSDTSPFGVYTSLGTTGNIDRPSGRVDAGSWSDKAGNLWLFGGSGWTDQYDGGYKFLNDIWKYNISSGQWTWVKGSDVSDKTPVYGPKGLPGGVYTPGGRWGFAYASDAAGYFWIFGGRQTDGNALSDDVGDLWRYDPSDNRWTWMGGSQQWYSAGVYGTMGVPDAANMPGSRVGSRAWCDNFGNIWFFGGFGHDGNSTYGYMNDLWKFGNCVPESYSVQGSRVFMCAGESVTLSVAYTGSLSWSTGETTPEIVAIPQTNTTYSVTLYDHYDCALELTFSAQVSACNAISETANSKQAIDLFPNPSYGEEVNIRSHTGDDFTLSIFDAIGKLVISETLTPQKSALTLRFDPGIYFYRANDPARSTGKIIVR